MPRILAMALPEGMKGSVQMAAAGMPAFSKLIASCTLHVLHDPQSPIAVITASHFSTSSSTISCLAGRDTSRLFKRTTPFTS